MPSLANITVKKNDGTTDIVWTGVVAAAGDKSKALFRSLTVGSSMAFQPTLEVSTREGGNGVRWLMVGYRYPQIATDTTTGITTIVNTFSFQGQYALPKAMPSVDLNEAVSQFANLMASTLLKDTVKSMYAPT
jgi:hypothetical protein